METAGRLFVLLCVGLAISSVRGSTCTGPQVDSSVYTTTEAISSTETVFIIQFSLTCKNGAKDVNLYADVNGKAVEVTRTGEGSKYAYQVSTSEEPKVFPAGTYNIKFYDEDGFTALKKAQRSGEKVDSITSLFSIAVNHPMNAEEINSLPDVLAGGVSLLPELLTESRAPSTAETYKRGFKRWCDWALSNNIPSKDTLPAGAFQVALYLASLIQSANSPSPIMNAFYSIKWHHELLDLPSPTDSNLVKNVLEAGKRRLCKPVKKKEPITVSVLEKVYHSLYKELNVYNQRTICALLLSFAAFLRSNELLNLRRCDIEIFPMYMSVFIQSSKTDKYRDGAWVPVARTGTVLCPVGNLEKYFLWAKIANDSDCFLFSQLTKTKTGYRIRETQSSLAYSNLRKLFTDAVKPFVKDVKSFCLHSLRSGGATAAANRGIPDRLFKRHGRWSSESAKDGYVKDSLDERLRVSQCLGCMEGSCCSE